MPETTVLLRISGRVQGVGFRAWTVRTAAELGLRGWVRNLADGSVEALACGDRETLDRFVDQCRRGPQFAGVKAVDVRPADPADKQPPAPAEGFRLLDTAG